MFITYNRFIKKEYEERCDSNVLREIYRKEGGFKAFKRNYVTYNGFSEYLVFIRSANGLYLATMSSSFSVQAKQMKKD
jgi:hypothetical protein